MKTNTENGSEKKPETTVIKLRLVRKSATEEWLVKVWINGVYSEDQTYYTDDKGDALQTLTAMSQNFTRQGYSVI